MMSWIEIAELNQTRYNEQKKTYMMQLEVNSPLGQGLPHPAEVDQDGQQTWR